jgi:hypothetical protein
MSEVIRSALLAAYLSNNINLAPYDANPQQATILKSQIGCE